MTTVEAPLTMVVEEFQSHPAPIHTSRQPWPEAVAVPRSVRLLENLAANNGWGVNVTYSQGYVATTGRGKVKLVHTILVRMTRALTVDGVIRRGAVYYEAAPATPLKWVAKECVVMGQDHWLYSEGLSVTAMREWVQLSHTWTGAQVDAWAQPLKAKAVEAKAHAATRAKAAPAKARVTA